MQERIQEERNVGGQEGGARLRMGGDTLQQGQRIAHPVRLVRGQGGRIDGRVDVDDLLQQGGRRAEAVPQHRGQVGDGFPLLAQLEQGRLARFRIGQLVYPLEHLLGV